MELRETECRSQIAVSRFAMSPWAAGRTAPEQAQRPGTRPRRRKPAQRTTATGSSGARLAVGLGERAWVARSWDGRSWRRRAGRDAGDCSASAGCIGYSAGNGCSEGIGESHQSAGGTIGHPAQIACLAQLADSRWRGAACAGWAGWVAITIAVTRRVIPSVGKAGEGCALFRIWRRRRSQSFCRSVCDDWPPSDACSERRADAGYGADADASTLMWGCDERKLRMTCQRERVWRRTTFQSETER